MDDCAVQETNEWEDQQIRMCAREVFGREALHAFQVEATRYLVCGQDVNRTLMVVAKTGSGKSMIVRLSGALLQGVTLMIVPTIPLGIDQVENYNAAIQDFYTSDPMNKDVVFNAFHLETIGGRQNWLVELLTKWKTAEANESDMLGRVLLVCSPATLLNVKLPWGVLLKDLAMAGTFRLCVIDEAHVFVEDGLVFRREFRQLQHFFEYIRQPTLAFLIMSASMTNEYQQRFQEMTTLCFSKVLWSEPSEMSRHDSIQIEITCRSVPTTMMSSEIKAYLAQRADGDLSLVYVNTADMAKRMKKKIDEINLCLVDKKSISEVTDTHAIYGDLSRDEKVFLMRLASGRAGNGRYINEFNNKMATITATSQCVNCGIDHPNITLAVRLGLMACLAQFLQEMGRLVRGVGTGLNRRYVVIINIDSFCYLLGRMPKNNTPEKLFQKERLFEVLRFIVLGDECLHYKLARHFGRQGSNSFPLQHCGAMCTNCDGATQKKLKPSLMLNGLKLALVTILADGPVPLSGTNNIVSALKNRHESVKELNIWKNQGINVYQIEYLVLQLVAAGLLETKVVFKNDTTTVGDVFVQLALDGYDRAIDVASKWVPMHLNLYAGDPRNTTNEMAARIG